MGAGVGLLAAVGARVLREARRHAEALAADPAAERPQPGVDALVILQVGQLSEAFSTSGALKGPLIGMRPHVNTEGGIVGKFLVANLALEARPAFGLAERSLEVGQHVLLQGAVGGKSAAARPHRALEGRLTCVGQPVEVEALLGHAAMAAEVAFDLPGAASSPLAPTAARVLLLIGGRASLHVDLQHRVVDKLG